MRRFAISLASIAAVFFLTANFSRAQSGDLDARLAKQMDSLVSTYKQLHEHPELSAQEKETSALIAGELRKLGYEVTDHFGRYEDANLTAYGVVAVLRNGPGPTVMVRTDMDALPIVENTGLPYASKVRTRDRHDREVGVMHACGHDMHMTCWVGTARALVALKDRWKGTLVFIGQPAEEIGQGARAMLEDGLFRRFPKPTYALALHCDGSRPHGTVAFTEGLALANVDSVDITV